MKYITHEEVEPGDTILWAYDGTPAFKDEKGDHPQRPPNMVFYQVHTVERHVQIRLCDGIEGPITTVTGKGFGKSGPRARGWDLVPYDREVLLISREPSKAKTGEFKP